jgi:hypothetical protein
MTARSIAVLLAVPRAAIGQRTLTFMAVGTLLTQMIMQDNTNDASAGQLEPRTR